MLLYDKHNTFVFYYQAGYIRYKICFKCQECTEHSWLPVQEIPMKQQAMNSFFAKRVATTAAVSPVVKRPRLDDDEAVITNTLPISTDTKENSTISLFKDLATTLDRIEQTSKRLEITDIFTSHLYQLFKHAKSDVLPTIYLASGSIAPDYKGIELGIGEGLITKAIAQAFGKSVSGIKDQMKSFGDLAKVAEASRSSQNTMFSQKQLTVQHVYDTLVDMSQFNGKNTQQRKIDKILGLLSAASSIEARFLIRILSKKMKIGLSEQTILVAISRAAAKSSDSSNFKQSETILKSVYCEVPSYDIIIPNILTHGILSLQSHVKLCPSIPVKPMLAHPSKSIDAVLKRFENKSFTCEYKYDGERAQLHKSTNGAVHVYSRNSEDLSGKYPDVLEMLNNVTTVTSFILDCEAVAYDPSTNQILPFAFLQKRKRKNVSISDIKQPVIVYPFDLLYLNGQSLLQHSFEERRQLLLANFTQIPQQFEFANYKNCDDVEEISDYLNASIEDKCEGLMLKTLTGEDSSYEPSKRSLNWFKLKKDYLESTGGDSLDLVVIGAYHGKGKRTGGYGGYLMATYDKENEEYQSICKLGTGFKDEDLVRFSTLFEGHKLDKKRADYNVGGVVPDQWLDAVFVWEIKAADFTLSPIYTAANGVVDDLGISLRFPRFIREREDKKVEEATGPEQLGEMYKDQAQMQQGRKEEEEEEEDEF